MKVLTNLIVVIILQNIHVYRSYCTTETYRYYIIGFEKTGISGTREE